MFSTLAMGHGPEAAVVVSFVAWALQYSLDCLPRQGCSVKLGITNPPCSAMTWGHFHSSGNTVAMCVCLPLDLMTPLPGTKVI